MALLRLAALFCLYCVSIIGLYAQEDVAKCKAELKESLRTMQHLYTDTSAYMYMHFKATSVSAETKEVQQGEVKFYKKNQFVVIASDASSYYADNKDAFLIMPFQKRVCQIDHREMKLDNNAPADMFRTKIIDSAVVESCTVLKDNNKKILLKLPVSMSKALHISKIEYVWNTIGKNMLSYTVYYTDGDPLEYLKYEFIAINQHPVLPFQANTVHDIFLSGTNKLLPAYLNYQYIDLRRIK